MNEVPVVRDGRAEYTTCGGTLTRLAGLAYEYWHVAGDWYAEVPFRHVTFGVPLVWRVRLVKITGP